VARMDGERTEGASGVSTSNSEPPTTETLPDRSHTPGPWVSFYKHKYNEWHVGVPVSSGSMKLALFPDGCPTENPESDCRLIAAAPDLLALAKQYVAECADCGGTGRIVTRSGGSGWGDGGPDIREEVEPCGECEDIRKVIAKAEGRS